MKYIKLVIRLNPAYQEIFIVGLEDHACEGFQQNEDELTAYFIKERFNLQDREFIDRLLAAYPGKNFVVSEEIVAEQNWNLLWEQSIQPQIIGRFLVKPTWSHAKARPGHIMLEVDPKMAFGTGYHPTTRLMLEQMPELISEQSTVLDAGTGSGILAVAAVKLGAKKVIAFDNDEWSVTSARENKYLNDVSDKIKVIKGDHQVIEEGWKFDIILANITLTVIKEMLPALTNHLKSGGNILLSGFFENNIDELFNTLLNNGITNIKTTKEDEWAAITGQK